MYLNNSLISIKKESKVNWLDGFDDFNQIHKMLFWVIFVMEWDGKGNMGGLFVKSWEVVGDFV